MNSKKKYGWLILALLVVVISISLSWVYGNDDLIVVTPEIHFIDVGQGDSFFIDYGDYDILIDAGDNKYGDTVVKYLKKQKVDDIELLIATHPDADHIGGLDDVIDNFVVKQVVDSGKETSTKTYKDYLNSIESEKCIVTYDENMIIQIDEYTFIELYETGDEYKSKNDCSVVAKFTYKDFDLLLTGDMEKEAEKEFLKLYELETQNLYSKLDNFKTLEEISKIDILKVAHHGSKSSTSKELLNKLNPTFGVISLGADNKYHHPHDVTTKSLNGYGVQILRTDLLGNIVLSVSDDSTYTFNKDVISFIDNNITNNPLQITIIEDITKLDKLAITSVDPVAEIVAIKNITNDSISLKNWTLISELGNQIYKFPDGFVLGPHSSVNITSGKNALDDGLSNLKWSKSNMWNNSKQDPAVLKDPSGNEISRFN